jgi:putative transposase
MHGFKSTASAAPILSGIEMVHMMCKRQARYVYDLTPSIAEQFAILAA